MKNIFKTTIVIILALFLGFIALTSFNNPDEDIIGTWILENDSNSKWVFTNDNCYWYYNDILEDTLTYTIQDLSDVQSSGGLSGGASVTLCGHNVKTGGTEDYYLKMTDQDNEQYCYEILGLSDENLSLNFLGQAKIKVFNKQ